MKSAQSKTPGVTLRSVFIGLLLIPLNCYWVAQSEAVWGTSYLTINSLFFNVTFSLFFLALLNWFLRRCLPRLALTQQELLVVYVMLCIGSSVTGNNMLENLVASLGHGSWFATPENEWSEILLPYMPKWLTVLDKDVLRGFYEGDSTFYTMHHIKAWLGPLTAWATFVVVWILVMLCINVILRQQWTETEKLSYPIIQIPMEVTRGGDISTLFRNRLFIIGFSVSAVIDILNGLHSFYPVVPLINLKTNISFWAADKPWNAIGGLHIGVYLWVVGMTFFIPADLSLSCWVFYLLTTRGEAVVGSILGLNSIPGFPFRLEQAAGAWIGFFLVALWVTRKHLKQVFMKVIGKSPHLDDSKELFSYRAAVFGLICGMAFMVFFSFRGGMSFTIATLFFLLVMALEVTITRMRAELGPPQHEFLWAGADTIISTALGSRRLGKNNMAMMTLLYFTNRAVASHPMPHQLEGFKIAEKTGISNKRLGATMIIASIAGVVFSMWILLYLSYNLGATRFLGYYTGISRESFNRLGRWLNNPMTANLHGIKAMAGGLLFSIVLMVMRSRFIWWPFHPAGYVLSASGWAIHYIWFSFMLGWLAKRLVLNYGGISGYRRAVPFFVGLTLGEYIVGSLWTILQIIMGRQTYVFFLH